jgi:hypothetical protein
LGASLYDDGYKNITNTDISEVVISSMRSLHSSLRPQMEWLIADCTNMFTPTTNLQRHSFDVIIDKATMDTLLFRHKTIDGISLIHKMLHQVYSLLAENGIYIWITSRKRFSYLVNKQYPWQIYHRCLQIGAQNIKIGGIKKIYFEIKSI